MDETEEEIANQLQELQTLMATLDISEKGKNIEEPEDESKFIYDFDSESSLGNFEEEEPQVGLVKTDNPESSDQGHKRGRRDGKEEFIDQ